MVRVKKLANNYPTAEPVAKVKFFYFYYTRFFA